MRLALTLAALPLFSFTGCSTPELQAQAGYMLAKVDGNFGYVQGSSQAVVSQDVGSAFGLGSNQGAPYGRVTLDTGVPTLSVSGFTFSDSGDGTLNARFGQINPTGVAVPVHSDLTFTNLKGALAFDIDIGPVAISPGLAVDWFDIDLMVADRFGITTERVQLTGPLPLPFLRAEADLGPVTALAEVGYIGGTLSGVDAKLLDIEAQLQVRPTGWLDLFVGYRYLGLSANGTVSNDTYDVDLNIGGLMFGGGVRF